ncbi:TetR family transcriptional regulator [Saccharothrix sp. ALI-22-I]|uniref:TetR/AcrR family transcriptional regulator n=1 Tax=Saccharothrix sp. ALI-22-I TaxID=1933778 RepID=UPI00097C9571|nr:TetR/AcrR family transcriptional regulator [Saccharothrix sp. ALI-22-I]ONI80360.1 TetR family transcriptional regulator [Saccharothrix sp. ALI-22-I]
MTETADRIAAAALAILLAEGAQAVTMRRVAADAGVTAMATYRHFPNREALLRSVVDAAVAEMTGDWRERGRDLDFAARVDVLADAFLDFALGRPNLYRYLVTDHRSDALRFPDDFRAGGSPAFAPAFAAVEQALKDGVLLDDDPLEVTLALTTPVMGLVQLHLGGRMNMSEQDFRALCKRTTGRVLNGLRT